MSEKKKRRNPDWWILITVGLLLAVGIIMVFSSSQYFAKYEPYNDTYYFLKEQAGNIFVGLIAMVFAYKVNLRVYYRLAWPVYIGICALLLVMVVLSELGLLESAGGASRWLVVAGFNFQPSELAKIALPLLLARRLSDTREYAEDFRYSFLPALGLLILPCVLIVAGRDLSSAVVVGATGVIMLFCGGILVRYLLMTFAMGAAGIAAAIALFPFRMDRIYAWFDPWEYAQDEGFQAVQSLMALGSGGLSGVGLGAGGSKWFYLPERHTDFIFSVLGEELGFLGGVFLILLFAVLVWRGILTAVRCKNTFASLLAMGLICSIAVQALVNLGVVTGLLPVTGVTLPFISYGGTSMVVTLTMVGVILNVSRYRDRI
ncbi:MAG: putative lipid II flippase FtsW [Bacillota bacterium]|nr:putative lipid II flippase FtsW [Bacillota bacterium]